MGAQRGSKVWLAAGALAAGASTLAGCSGNYIYAAYGPPAAPVLVTVGCHTTYEVYDNLKQRTMMVRTNVVAGVASALCRDEPGASPPPRRAVEIHLEKTNRPKCTVVEERRLTAIHMEYVYTCRT